MMTTQNPAIGNTDPSATPAATPAPAASAPPVTTPAVAPAQEPAADPQWLAKRLERERTKTIKGLGFADEADAKAAADARTKAAEAQKTAEQRAVEATGKLATTEAEKTRALAVVTEHAARMMVGLTAEQKAAVTAVAGDDPIAQLKAIGALAPTWAAAAPTPAPGTTPPAAAVTTAPAASAPNGNTPAPTSPRAIYESTRQANPFAAAAFGATHPEAYVKPQ